MSRLKYGTVTSIRSFNLDLSVLLAVLGFFIDSTSSNLVGLGGFLFFEHQGGCFKNRAVFYMFNNGLFISILNQSVEKHTALFKPKGFSNRPVVFLAY